MKAKDSSSTPRRSSATSGWREMPSMHRPEAMPWPTPEPIAAKPMAKPAPMADKAGIHTEPSSANAACGVTKVAAVKAAAVPVLAVGADTWELRGAGTKAVRNAPQHSSTAPVRTKERAMSTTKIDPTGNRSWYWRTLSQGLLILVARRCRNPGPQDLQCILRCASLRMVDCSCKTNQNKLVSESSLVRCSNENEERKGYPSKTL